MTRRGFTLLETLVALAVTAVILAALAGTLRRAVAARAHATEAADRLAETRAILLRLAHELEAAASSETDRLVLTSGSTLGFTTLAAERGDPRVLAYRVERGALVRQDRSRFAPSDAGDITTVLDRVRTFHVRCFDGATWTGDWAAPRLPRAVELVLGVDDGSGRTSALRTTVALPLGRSG